MSTPRTDAALLRLPSGAIMDLLLGRDAVPNHGTVVLAAFARELERESAAKDALIGELRDELGKFKASEHLLHVRYMRIRELVGAFDTDEGGENRFAVTEAKINELREDRARLDWLEQNHADLHCNMSEHWTLWSSGAQYDGQPTARTAIDAARNPPKKTGSAS